MKNARSNCPGFLRLGFLGDSAAVSFQILLVYCLFNFCFYRIVHFAAEFGMQTYLVVIIVGQHQQWLICGVIIRDCTTSRSPTLPAVNVLSAKHLCCQNCLIKIRIL